MKRESPSAKSHGKANGKEFKEFEETKKFQELASKIPSWFVALDSAMSPSLTRITQFAAPEHNFSSLNS
jgi:hypothetical protein